MSADVSLIGRITRQGPPAPVPGDALALPVYGYRAITAAATIARGDLLDVAHRDADPGDPGFAVDALRRLKLAAALPPRATLLFADRRPPSGRCWYCPASEPVTGEVAP